MRLFGYILIITSLCLPAFVSCNAENDNTLVNQRRTIDSYINSNYREDYEDPTVEIEHNGVYRIVINRKREGRAENPMIGYGDRIAFRYTGKIFNSSPQSQTVFMSNDPEVIDSLVRDQWLDDRYWSRQLFRATLGNKDIIEGLERGLEGLHEKDSAVLIIPSEYGYGDKSYGLVPANSALIYDIYIDTVEK